MNGEGDDDDDRYVLSLTFLEQCYANSIVTLTALLESKTSYYSATPQPAPRPADSLQRLGSWLALYMAR